MSSIELTDENFKETKLKIGAQSIEVLNKIANRFKIPPAIQEESTKDQLVELIVSKIKHVMIHKYQPPTYDDFYKTHTTLVEQLILSSSATEVSDQNVKKEASIVQKDQDPSERLKIVKMAGNFQVSRVEATGEKKIQKLVCTSCQLVFDYGIMRWPVEKQDQFVCPHCIILSNDPLNEVIDILFEPSILRSNQNYTYKLSYDKFALMSKDPMIGVEVRCLKLDGEHLFD